MFHRRCHQLLLILIGLSRRLGVIPFQVLCSVKGCTHSGTEGQERGEEAERGCSGTFSQHGFFAMGGRCWGAVCGSVV